MNYTLILSIIASLAVGCAAGAGATHYLTPQVTLQKCPQDNSWKQFLGAPVQSQMGKTYK